jgi:hypothetical protein
MFCPQCGNESSEGQHYCRSCGTNLKVIGKAVTLGDAISRTDGVPAKVKEIMSNIKIAHVTDEVSRAMEKMNKEIVRSSNEPTGRKPWWIHGKTKTAEERRERHLVNGTIKLFWGGGLSIFLYFLSHALILKLPPQVIASVPFEIDPVVRVLWLIGLIPMLSGFGHIIAGLSIRPQKISAVESAQVESAAKSPLRIDPQTSAVVPEDPELTVANIREAPASVTDRTTNILDRDRNWQKREIQ